MKRNGTQSKLLRNFTGVVQRMKDGTVQIIGKGLKSNPKKRATKRKRRTAKPKLSMQMKRRLAARRRKR